MQWYLNFYKTIYNPAFYRTLQKTSLRKALLYFIILCTVLALISTIIFGFSYYQKIDATIDESVPYILNQYPEDLEISIWDGKVATNLDAPFFFQMPESWEKSDRYLYPLMINTDIPFTQESFEGYMTYMWLTEDALYFVVEDETRVLSLAGVKHFYLNKGMIIHFIDRYSALVPFGAPIVLLLWFVYFFLDGLFTLYGLLLLSLFFYGVTSMRGLHLTYKQVYISSIYASTLVVVMQLLIYVVPLLSILQSFPYLFTILTVLIFSGNVLFAKQQKTSNVNRLMKK